VVNTGRGCLVVRDDQVVRVALCGVIRRLYRRFGILSGLDDDTSAGSHQDNSGTGRLGGHLGGHRVRA